MTVFEKIEAMQKGKEESPVWTVGEQLKDICRREPACAKIVAEDLENEGMTLEACEWKIKAWADSHRGKGNCVCVPPNVAEGIIRKFFGLPETGAVAPAPAAESPAPKKKTLDFDSFF